MVHICPAEITWQEATTCLRLTGDGHHARTPGSASPPHARTPGDARPVPSWQDAWRQATTHQTLGIIGEQNPRHGATPRGRAQRSAGLPTSGAPSSWSAVQFVAALPHVAACSAPPVCRCRARQAAGRLSTPSQRRVPVPRCPRLSVPTPPVLSVHAAN
jgi:hypothetical protein